jgi:hypothetical protein
VKLAVAKTNKTLKRSLPKQVHASSMHPHRVKHIVGDGNCLFRSFSYLITGTERQRAQVRAAILNHLRCTEHRISPHIRVHGTSVSLSTLMVLTWTEMERGVQILKF